MYFGNIRGHLRTVLLHRKYVRHYCFLCGLYLQGILHDLSKFSPVEFMESARYYTGTRSPIEACKAANEYSLAWFHHRGRNRHHWEYWYDNFEKGGYACKMPWKYVLEMVCDWLGAGAAYAREIRNFSFESEYAWWQSKRITAKLHPHTLRAVDSLFGEMKARGMEPVLADRHYLKELERQYADMTERIQRHGTTKNYPGGCIPADPLISMICEKIGEDAREGEVPRYRPGYAERHGPSGVDR